jgi:plasmid stability protein
MATELKEDDLLIEDLSPDLLQRIEARARSNGRSVEEEALVLLEIGLQLSENDR